MLKKYSYLLFMGDDFYAKSGSMDLHGVFPDYDSAVEYVNKICICPVSLDWVQLLRLPDRKIFRMPPYNCAAAHDSWRADESFGKINKRGIPTIAAQVFDILERRIAEGETLPEFDWDDEKSLVKIFAEIAKVEPIKGFNPRLKKHRIAGAGAVRAFLYRLKEKKEKAEYERDLSKCHIISRLVEAPDGPAGEGD